MTISNPSELLDRLAKMAVKDINGIARDYLTNTRKISSKVLDDYRDAFGYLDVSMVDALKSEMDDVFRDSPFVQGLTFTWDGPRIVFVVRDLMNDVIGLELRALEEKSYRKIYHEDRKKWNPIFWGLRQSLRTIWETGRVFVFEGIIDALSFSTCLPHLPCLPILSKSLSPNHEKFFERYVGRISFCFDRGTERITSGFIRRHETNFMIDRIDWRKSHGLNLRGITDINQVLLECGVCRTRQFLLNQFPDI